MFRYYGRKTSYIHLYPPPKHKTIIEPFAGSASYSLHYWKHNVILIEKDHVLYGIWRYLIEEATPRKILNLPILEDSDHMSDTKYDKLSQAQKDLIGFFLNSSCPRPARKTSPSPTYSKWNAKTRAELAEDVKKIKHWKIIHGDYTKAPNRSATWFIDPPYQGKGGKYYRHSNRGIDYRQLAKWVKTRKGQTVVCENEDGRWLPFKSLKERSQNGQKHTEMIYHRSSQKVANPTTTPRSCK